MFRGYVCKRTTPISPPPMQKVYCVLWGTLLFDYENEEDAKSSLSPKLVVEILGVSEWDGKGRANNYPGGFLLVTHTGGTYYVSVSVPEERDEWILQMRRALECVFANPEVAPFKPSKIIQNRPQVITNMLCPVTHQPVSGGTACRSCGRCFSSSDYVAEAVTMLQLGSEEIERVCLDCSRSQMCILWLKSMNYVHTLDLHEATPAVLRDVHKFKGSFRVRRRLSQRLDMAAELYDGGNLTAEEFEELRSVDHAYRREIKYEECHRLRVALEAFGDDVQTILGVLLDSNLTDKGGAGAYFKVIVRVLHIADGAPDLLDFYFPQLFQVHLLHASDRTAEALRKVDLLQQALLVLAQKYPGFGLKLACNLLAVIEDYPEGKASAVQYAACACLLMQLEMVTAGIVSAIADKPSSRVLQRILRPAAHQQQELGYELGALFLIRRTLQEQEEDEEAQRLQRHKVLGTAPGHEHEGEEEDEGVQQGERAQSPDPSSSSCEHDPNAPIPPVSAPLSAPAVIPVPVPVLFPGSRRQSSCLEMLYHLGVGQRHSSHGDREDDGEEEDEGEGSWEGFSRQLDFISGINALVDSLRFVDRALRTDMLRRELHKYNANHGAALGWDPIRVAGEPAYRITRVIVEDCRVFRTKARAPSLIVAEVMRDDHFPNMHHSARGASSSSSPPRHLATQKSRNRADSHSHAFPSSSLQQSMQDVDSLVGPAILAALPLHAPEEVRADTKGSQMLHMPRPRGSQILPVNRLAASTEGILRSAGPHGGAQRGRRRGSEYSHSAKVPSPPPTSGHGHTHHSHSNSNSNSNSGTNSPIPRSVSAPQLHDPEEGEAEEVEEREGEGSACSTSSRSSRSDGGGAGGDRDRDHHPQTKVLSSAHRLLQQGLIDAQEFEKLLACDAQYRDEVAREEALQTKSRVEVALGETFMSKKERILGPRHQEQEHGDVDHWPAFDLRAFIVKTNDDLRQEICCLQLMAICKEIFAHFGLSDQLYLHPYRIACTGSASGVVEVLTDAISLDQLKKTPGFVSLAVYFRKTYEPGEQLATAKHNFMSSLAAYSLFSYLLQIKDRHNGNLLIDSEGHIVHIDFGFLLSIAPGGSFSLETAPFKLTEEMVELLGGLDSPLFGDFVTAFTKGFIALQANCSNILSALSVLAQQSSFPCLQGKPVQQILDKLRGRFRSELGVQDAVKHCLDLITNSYGHYGTSQYDRFQYYTNGILP